MENVVSQADTSPRLRDGLARHGFEELVTVREAAELSRHSRSYVYLAIYRGQLAALRHGRSWRLKVSDVKAWIETDH